MKESDMMNIKNKNDRAMRTHCFWGGLLCLLALSCNTDRLEQDPVTDSVELTFYADLGDNQDTRTVLQEDRMSIWWSPRDSIRIFCGDASGLFISNNVEPVSRAVFTGSLNMATATIDNENTPGTFIAIYPYRLSGYFSTNMAEVYLPTDQIAADNTFARGMYPAAAISQNLSLSFYNICGGIVFTVQEEGIKYVTLTGNNNEAIAGRARISFTGNIPSANILSGETSITLKAPGGETFTPGVRYFISVYPQTFEQGIKLTFNKAAAKSEVTFTKPATIKRSRFLVIENADADAGEYEFAIPEEAYKDMDALADVFMTKIASQGGASLYAPLRVLFNYCGDDVFGAGAMFGDIDELGSLSEFRFGADNAVVQRLYTNFYDYIRQASSLIAKYQDDLPQVAAPARVLRAYSHLMLAIGWGRPPVVDHVLAESEFPANNVFTQKQIFEWCAQECEASIPALAERESPQDKEGAYTVTKGFAQAIAGKAYLFAGNYAKAKELLAAVINSGKYALVPGERYWENFHVEGDGNEEKIYEPNIEYDSSIGAWNGPIQHSTWMESNVMNWRSDHFVAGACPQRVYTGSVDGWGGLGVPQWFGDEFFANDGHSPRFDATLKHIDDAVYNMEYSNEIDFLSLEDKKASTQIGISDTNNGLYSQSFWLPFKQLIRGSDSSGYGNNIRMNNYTIMRYAEVLLLYAEACLQSGDSAQGAWAVNQIRQRAGLAALDRVDMSVLKKEKSYELWLEGSRWPDLVRWGDTDRVEKAGQDVPKLFDKLFRVPMSGETVRWENGTEADSRFYVVSSHEAIDAGNQVGFVPGKHNLFPYPMTEMNSNPNLVQNPGW